MKKRKGSSLLEFSLVGVPLILMSLSVLQMSIAMWQFYTMQHAIQTACRYIATHGRGCTTNGNTCGLTVGSVAGMIAGQALALDPSRLNISLVTAAGTQACNPVNSCNSNSNPFPSSTANAVDQDVSITATYMVTDPLMMFWPGAALVTGSNWTLGAKTRQRIAF
jgi:Flp pilus assembly protein TadG